MSLLTSAVLKFTLGAAVTGLLLFLPAGTVHWVQGWVFMAVLFVPMFLAGLVMLAKNPKLLQSRLNAREDQAEQAKVVKLSGLMFLAGFLLAGFNYRYGWLILPDWVSWTAAVIFLLSYGLYGEVLRENTYLSRTIEVQEGQTVVDTGLYGIVRHPMYAVTLVLFLSMPLILGSLWSFLVFLSYPPIIAARIRNEEQVLKRELPGYEDYCRRVRWRLFPGIW